MNPQELEKRCLGFINGLETADPAHDLAHTERVVANARKILESEKADTIVTLTAAWLHDCVVLPKNDPERKRASSLAAEKAAHFLRDIGFPTEKIDQVTHAIKAHSFSADIKPETVEAKIVQDADRLEALGAIGIARCMIVGGKLGRQLYDAADPFCRDRDPDDGLFTIDHFYTKLLKLPETMNTEAARNEARIRAEFMIRYLKELEREIK